MTGGMVPADVARTIVDPLAFADDDKLQEAYRWLRQNQPVAKISVEGFDDFWAVTKHADISEIGRNPNLFHNADRQATLIDQAGDAQNPGDDGRELLI